MGAEGHAGSALGPGSGALTLGCQVRLESSVEQRVTTFVDHLRSLEFKC